MTDAQRGKFADQMCAAVAEERERCARIADERTITDMSLYEREKDWRWPYCLNRVLRASMDIAAAIRNPKSE